jgi:hypothetical protein
MYFHAAISGIMIIAKPFCRAFASAKDNPLTSTKQGDEERLFIKVWVRGDYSKCTAIFMPSKA